MQFQLKRFRAGWATGSTEQRGGRHEETEGLRVGLQEHAESNKASLVDAVDGFGRVCSYSIPVRLKKEFAYLRLHTKERQKEINRPVRAHRRATGMRRRPQRVEAAYRARLVRRGPETLRDMVVLLPLACAIPGFNLVCHQASDVTSEFLSMRAERARVCERWCAVSSLFPLLCFGLDFNV